jgi:hypothetical protein
MHVLRQILLGAALVSAAGQPNAQQIMRPPVHGIMTQIIVGNASSSACARTHREGLEGLLVSVGGVFVDAVGDAVEKYVTDFANKYSSDKQTLLTSGDFYQFKVQNGIPKVNMELSCIIIVRGKVGRMDADIQKVLIANRKVLDPRGRLTGSTENIDLEFFKDFKLVDYPEMYLEFVVDRHDTADLFKVTPVYLYFRKGAADLSNGAVDIIVTLTFIRAAGISSTTDSARGFNTSSTVIRIRSVSPNTENLASDLFFETGWAPLPPLPGAADLNAVKSKTENMTVLEPYNLIATYQETGEAPAIVKFFADIAKEVEIAYPMRPRIC